MMDYFSHDSDVKLSFDLGVTVLPASPTVSVGLRLLACATLRSAGIVD